MKQCNGKTMDCLLCNGNLKSIDKKQFVYCNLCVNRAFRIDLSDHQIHDDQQFEQNIDYLVIDGILVTDEVIDCNQELELVNRLDNYEWIDSQNGRRKQDFGPRMNFKKHKFKLGNFTGLPLMPMQILDQLIDTYESIKMRLDNFNIIDVCHLEYTKDRSSSIPPHFDDFYFYGHRIVTLNLLSSTKLILSKSLIGCKKKLNINQKIVSNLNDQSDKESGNDLDENHSQDVNLDNVEIIVNLKRRSLLILSDEARYEWMHEIRSEHIDGSRRLAITFRELSKELQPGGSQFTDQIYELLRLSSNRID